MTYWRRQTIMTHNLVYKESQISPRTNEYFLTIMKLQLIFQLTSNYPLVVLEGGGVTGSQKEIFIEQSYNEFKLFVVFKYF